MINWSRELTLAIGDWGLTIEVIRFLRDQGTCGDGEVNRAMAECSRVRFWGSAGGSLGEGERTETTLHKTYSIPHLRERT